MSNLGVTPITNATGMPVGFYSNGPKTKNSTYIKELVTTVQPDFATGLLSSIPTGCNGLYACKWVNSLYTGPILKLRANTDTTGTQTQDFYMDKTGSNIGTSSNGTGTTLSNWLISKSNATIAYVTTWYDQSVTGNSGGRNATQTVLGSQPKYDFTKKLINQAVPVDSFFNLPDGTVPYGNSAYTVTAKHGNINTNTNGTWLYSGELATALSANSFRILGTTYRNAWIGNAVDGGTLNVDNVVTFTYNSLNTPDATKVFVNGDQQVAVIAGVNTTRGIRTSTAINNQIGKLIGELYYLWIYNADLTNANRIIIEGI